MSGERGRVGRKRVVGKSSGQWEGEGVNWNVKGIV